MKELKITITCSTGKFHHTEVKDQDGNYISCKSIRIEMDKNGVWALLKVRPESVFLNTDNVEIVE